METTSVSYIRDVCLGLVHGVYYSRWHLFHSYAVVPVVVAAACGVSIVSFAYSLFDINQAVDELYLEMDQCIFHSIVHHFAAFRPHKFHRVPQDSGCVCGGVFGSLFP